MLTITALMDNRLTGRKDLLSEHGLSFYIDYNGRRILFDCGSSEKMLYNAKKLGVDLEATDCVVLSHGHYDHAGGFRFLTEEYPVKRLYTGPGFFETKYAKSESCYKSLGAGFDRAFLEKQQIPWCQVDGVMELFAGVYGISGFPQIHEEERVPQRFVRMQDGKLIPDDFGDEMCLALDTAQGLVMVVGCAHPGILNMVSHVSRVLDKPVCGIYGGTHLVEADAQRIHRTAQALRERKVAFLGLSHCTGELAENILRSQGELELCRLGPGDCVFFDR